MIYLPNKAHLNRLKLLEWPLPRRLLPWLIKKRGLGIVVLPEGEKNAHRIIHKRLRIKEQDLPGDGRLTHRTAHYRHDMRLVILTQKAFWGHEGENIFLHEIGHAVDFLYSDRQRLSDNPRINNALEPDRPLNQYCADKQKQHGNLLEQFATAFSAYFTEYEEHSTAPSINKLHPEMIKIFNRLLMEKFA